MKVLADDQRQHVGHFNHTSQNSLFIDYKDLFKANNQNPNNQLTGIILWEKLWKKWSLRMWLLSWRMVSWESSPQTCLRASVTDVKL